MDQKEYLQERHIFWEETNMLEHKGRIFSRFYHQKLEKTYQFHIPAGKRILELGCGRGELLESLKPIYGVGLDFSESAIAAARLINNPNLHFIFSAVEDLKEALPSGESFDVVILSDLINDLWNVQDILEKVGCYCRPDTRLILNFYSRMWQLPLNFGKLIGQANHVLQQNWFTPQDVANILYLSGFESLRKTSEFLFPLPCPILEPLFNRFFARIWPFRLFNLANFIIARPLPKAAQQPYKVSVVVPARNEEGNITRIIESTPELGAGTELIFVEGNSTDHTYQKIREEMPKYPLKEIKLYQQTGKGKGDAVRMGYQHATGDILMILDADLTVSADSLPDFYQALADNKGEFINGVRLVYPMEGEAMRFANLLGNKAFSWIFSWMLGQPLKDTLCGTKVMWKRDYDVLAANRSYFGDFDPFGDYDLIFGAAKMDLKIVDLPIRYKDRTYGTTNISRWRHGVILLRMVLYAARKLKFY